MERFYSKVKKLKSGCWEWVACKRGKTGYGAFKFEGKLIDAHRMSYIIAKGYIPSGFLVCHTCNNRLCVNPKHLILGTYKDNHNDGVKNGTIRPKEQKGKTTHPGHGAYNRGCRCAECKKIHNDCLSKWRLGKKLNKTPD